MARIIDSWQASDGWDVQCVLTDGRTQVFHTHAAESEPKDLEALVAPWGADIVAAEEESVRADSVVESELAGLREEVATLQAALIEATKEEPVGDLLFPG